MSYGALLTARHVAQSHFVAFQLLVTDDHFVPRFQPTGVLQLPPDRPRDCSIPADLESNGLTIRCR